MSYTTAKKGFSFREQLLLIFLSLSLIIGLGSLFVINKMQNNLIKTNLHQQANAITSLLIEDIANMIFFDSATASANITARIKSIPEIYSVYFFDDNNNPLLTIRSNFYTSNNSDFINNTIKITDNITHQDYLLGHANFVFYSEVLNQKKQSTTKILIFLLFIFLILSALLTLYIDKKFISRLAELSLFLKNAMEKRDFSSQITIHKQDDIGVAQQNFNRLINMVKKNTDDLEFKVNHDNLTGLYNRHYLLNEIQTSLAKHSTLPSTLCYIDLDQFKIVNDSCGHIAGDQLLIQLSAVLSKLTPANTTLGRIGGDEFILLIRETALDNAKKIIRDLHQHIREFIFTFKERSFMVDASIGVIFYHNQNINSENLLSAANTACYQAKNEGRDKLISYHIDDPKIQLEQNHLSLVNEIYQALEKDYFQIFLQPIVPIKPINTVFQHYETLIRLKNETSFISPAVFIPVAERYGLSKKIDLWVINNLCLQLQAQPDFIESLNLITINLSADTLMDETLINKIELIINKHKISFNKLCFEITETGIISNLEKVQNFINFFTKKGISFALDDFGAGMSSFGYLSKLPVSYLKIDGEFVKNIENDMVMKEMVIAMNRIGHITNKKVIAEYVETENAVQILQQIGVDYIQGYYFSEPKPIQYFIDLGKT